MFVFLSNCNWDSYLKTYQINLYTYTFLLDATINRNTANYATLECKEEDNDRHRGEDCRCHIAPIKINKPPRLRDFPQANH